MWTPQAWPKRSSTPGFEVDDNDNGTAIINYHNNTRYEGEYLAALAPYVRDGSYLERVGAQPGDRWRYVVRSGRLVSQHPIVEWADDLTQPTELSQGAAATKVVVPAQ